MKRIFQWVEGQPASFILVREENSLSANIHESGACHAVNVKLYKTFFSDIDPVHRQ